MSTIRQQKTLNKKQELFHGSSLLSGGRVGEGSPCSKGYYIAGGGGGGGGGGDRGRKVGKG
jgi:hypothetical protein